VPWWETSIPNETNADVDITDDTSAAIHLANNNTKVAALIRQTKQAAMVTKLAIPIFNPWKTQSKKGASPMALLIS